MTSWVTVRWPVSAAWTRRLAVPPERLATVTVHDTPLQVVAAGAHVAPSSQDSCTVGVTTGRLVAPSGTANATVKENLPAGALFVDDSDIR